jgi:5-methylthioadenosine/S-adenosylhomocysteine deaminase
MSLFRGLAEDLSLEDWLTNYIFPAEARNVTPEFVSWGARLSMLEAPSSASLNTFPSE